LLCIEIDGAPQRIVLRKTQAGQRQIYCSNSVAGPAPVQNSTLSPSCVRRP
jgi:hypothetical protein